MQNRAMKEPPRFSNLFVFGDGFSDPGNAFAAAGGLSASGGDRRFTNELTWVDYLADYLWLSVNLPTAMQAGEGINFAVGGATTGTANIYPELLGLQQQIAAFTGSIKKRKKADPDALYIIWAGAVDYAPLVNDAPMQTESTTPIAQIEAAVLSLAKVGARHILVVNVPDLSQTPLVRSLPTQLDAVKGAIAAHNKALDEMMLRLAGKAHLIGFDVRSVLAEIIEDAKHFGFKNAIESGNESGNPNEYVFWDGIHPTSKVHQLIARAAMDVLSEATSLRLVLSCAL